MYKSFEGACAVTDKMSVLVERMTGLYFTDILFIITIESRRTGQIRQHQQDMAVRLFF